MFELNNLNNGCPDLTMHILLHTVAKDVSATWWPIRQKKNETNEQKKRFASYMVYCVNKNQMTKRFQKILI